MNLNDLFTEEKVRLDPKCWTGKKIGNPKTKVKGGVRVNNCVPADSVAEASDQSNAISQEQLNQMYANAKPMMFIKNTPVALVPLAKINQIGTPQQVQQVQQALGSVDQTSYTDEYKNKGYVVFQWNGTALDLYVASPEVVSQKYVKFSGQLPQDEKSRGKIPSLVALSKLGIDPSKVPFFVKKVPTQMVSAKQLGLENKTIQTSWGEQTVSPGGFMVREENGHIYTVAPDAQGLPIGYLPAQQGVAEAQTDYQKRRQRERDVDAGKPVKPPPKNPQNDYFARRKKERDMAEGVMYGAENLQRGDPVVITGNVEFEGKTGDIVDFGQDKRFVVVNLYNHGQQSFHSSDVSYNDYAGSDDMNADDHDDDMAEAKKQPPEAKYDDEYDAMVARVKKLAGLGPLKTVYDPAKRVYRNMPTAVQPKK